MGSRTVTLQIKIEFLLSMAYCFQVKCFLLHHNMMVVLLLQ